MAALLDEPTGRFREEQETGGEDDGESELNTDGNTVGARVDAVLRSVVDNRGEEETDSDGPLVSRHNGSADPAWCALGLVHWHDSRDDTNTETRDDTAGGEQAQLASHGADLHGDTDAEDGHGNVETYASAEVVGDGCTGQRADKRTGRKDRGDERDVVGWQIELLDRRVRARPGRVGLAKVAQERLHRDDTGDGARVVTVEDTTKGSKRGDQDGGEGLARAQVGGPRDLGAGGVDKATGHDVEMKGSEQELAEGERRLRRVDGGEQDDRERGIDMGDYIDDEQHEMNARGCLPPTQRCRQTEGQQQCQKVEARLFFNAALHPCCWRSSSFGFRHQSGAQWTDATLF